MIVDNENIIYNNVNGVEILQFKKLLKYNDIITHAYCIGIDRNFRTIKANKQEYDKALNDYKELCKALDVDFNNIIKTRQNHTDNVEIVSHNIQVPNFEDFENVDGLITDKSNRVLATTNADCILLLIFDPIKNIVANIHSGWRGTLQRISVKAVRKMKEQYGCDEKDIIVCMCPSIKKCHFEVEEEVYKLFYNEFKDINKYNEIYTKQQNKWHIDTILINKLILKNEGILEKNIVDSGICSVCNKESMHSFRAEGKKYGLNTAIISLK